MAVITDGNKKILSHTAEIIDSAITEANKIPTIETTLTSKVDVIEGKGLSTNDFTDEKSSQIDTNKIDILSLQTDKQNKLIAGTNITIGADGKTINASGTSEETITSAVNDYLTTNPPQAMTDEAIATSVNNSITGRIIDVTDKHYPFASNCINACPYIIDLKVYATHANGMARGLYINKLDMRNDVAICWIAFSYLDTKQQIFQTSKTTFGENAWSERVGIKKYSISNADLIIEFWIDWAKYNASYNFEQVSTGEITKCIFGTNCYEKTNYLNIPSKCVNTKSLISNHPFAWGDEGICSPIIDFKVYGDNDRLLGEGLYLKQVWYNYTDGVSTFSIFNATTNVQECVFTKSQTGSKDIWIGVKTYSVTSNGITFSITIDWNKQSSFVNFNQTTFENKYVFDKSCIRLANLSNYQNKSMTQNVIKEQFPFELGSYKNINNSILNLNIYTDSASIQNNGLYIQEFNNESALRFMIKECNTDRVVLNFTGAAIEPSSGITFKTLGHPNDEVFIEMTINPVLSKKYYFSDGTNLTSKIDKNIIKKKSKYYKENLELLYPNSVYTILNDNPSDTNKIRHAVPLYLDYGYQSGGWTAVSRGYEQEYNVLYKDGRDNKLFYSRTSHTTNIHNTKKRIEFNSEKYIVPQKVINHISLSKKTPNKAIRMLTIGDSVTAGAITKRQYWFKTAEYFAQEDIDMNRTSDVMMLGSNNFRSQDLTYKNTTKTITAGACGISSWSLNSWLNNLSTTTDYSSPSGLNGFLYEDGEGNKKFSILKWIERFRNYDDEGNKLEIGSPNLGTWITEANIDKVICCTPNIIHINSTHNGGTIEEHHTIMNVIKEELPSCKIIIGSPMPLLGSCNRNAYSDEWLIDEVECPYYGWQQGGNQFSYARYWLKYENDNKDSNFYYFPQSWLTPSVDSLEYDEYLVPGLNKIYKGLTTQPMPKEHPGTVTHDLWGYGLYSLLKYISIRQTEGYTTNEKSITFDKSEINLNVSETSVLTKTTSDTGDAWYGVYYSSDNKVATVDEKTGLVTAIGIGECSIYARNTCNIYPAVCKVTVTTI